MYQSMWNKGQYRSRGEGKENNIKREAVNDLQYYGDNGVSCGNNSSYNENKGEKEWKEEYLKQWTWSWCILLKVWSFHANTIGFQVLSCFKLFSG